MAETLLKHKLPHPPITLLFTVREESGLHGARETGRGRTGRGDDVLQRRQQARRRTDHRRSRPGELGRRNRARRRTRAWPRRKGISATLVAATALVEAQRGGWFGKVVKPEGKGTSNPGIFGGKDGKAAGDATNVVTDYVYIKGEARSPDAKFAAAIAAGYREAFKKAEPAVKDAGGETAEGEIQQQHSYPPFNLAEDSRRSDARQTRGGIDRPQAQQQFSPTAAWMPIGSSSTVCRR